MLTLVPILLSPQKLLPASLHSPGCTISLHHLLLSLPSECLSTGSRSTLATMKCGREHNLIPSAEALAPRPCQCPAAEPVPLLASPHELRTGVPDAKPPSTAFCSCSASAHCLLLISVSSASASPGLARHLTSCRAGPAMSAQPRCHLQQLHRVWACFLFAPASLRGLTRIPQSPGSSAGSHLASGSLCRICSQPDLALWPQGRPHLPPLQGPGAAG